MFVQTHRREIVYILKLDPKSRVSLKQNMKPGRLYGVTLRSVSGHRVGADFWGSLGTYSGGFKIARGTPSSQ